MEPRTNHIRNGIGTVRAYIYGRLDLLDFARQVLGAVELERNTVQNGFHVQAKIGDSVVGLAAMEPPYSAATLASIYVYVEDVDAADARALNAGATSLHAPKDQPYQERSAGVKDAFGNIWCIATYTGAAFKLNQAPLLPHPRP